MADLVAADDSVTTDEDTPVNGTVAGNDSTTSGGTLEYVKATDPSNGTVVVNIDGTYTYTPNANFNGTDSFTYTVTDPASGESLTQTVEITVNPVADLVAADDSVTTDEDTPVNGTVAGNDSTTSGGTLEYVKATDPSNGTVVVNIDGTYTYTPNANFNGTDSFTYTVTDPASGESLTQTVEITVNPVADLVAADDSVTTDEDTPVNGTVAGNDSTTSGGTLEYVKATDPSNGTSWSTSTGPTPILRTPTSTARTAFTYTVTDPASGETLTQTVEITVNPVADLVAADDSVTTDEDTPVNGTVAGNDSTTSGGTLEYVKATDPSNGTVVVNIDGTYTYTPNANFNGTDSFTYTVTDPASGESLTQTVEITVNPVADLVAADDSVTTDEDTPVNGTVAGNDSTTSGGTLEYVKATDPSNGTVVVNIDGPTPIGRTPTQRHGQLHLYGDRSGLGREPDADGGDTVNPVADLVAADDSVTTDEDTPVNGTVAGNDSTTSGGTLEYVKATDPSNGTVVVNIDGTYTYTPNANFNGTDSFTYTVTDPASGESLTQTVEITVNPVLIWWPQTTV
ncbi:Ig-like domain-containing protein [Brevundimonas diminuta]|uniref:Ig-like domain-containing protein n=1 Tax=Brevundimonas diminuta TaxID=293 RepID=UPI002092B195|nr:Ig-like domain-containing protein [Brevundimonas diminuta]